MSVQEETPGAGLSGEEVQQQAAQIAREDIDAQPPETSVLEHEGAMPAEPASPADAEGHPELVLDRDKAEYMGHASKSAELSVVANANQASKYGNSAIPGAVLDETVSERHRIRESHVASVNAERTKAAARHNEDKEFVPFPTYAEVAEEMQGQSIERAKKYRETADEQAQAAADAYDKHQNFVAEANDLKRGQSPPLKLRHKTEQPPVGAE